MKWGKLWGRCKEEVMVALGSIVGNSLESSCVSRIQWRLVVSYSFYIIAVAAWKLIQISTYIQEQGLSFVGMGIWLLTN